jgi:hypothetical protein
VLRRSKFEGDKADGVVIEQGMHAKEEMRKALLEELHCSVVASSHVILQSFCEGIGLPVRTLFYHSFCRCPRAHSEILRFKKKSDVNVHTCMQRTRCTRSAAREALLFC